MEITFALPWPGVLHFAPVSAGPIPRVLKEYWEEVLPGTLNLLGLHL